LDRNISHQPTDGLTYDPEDQKYSDKNALQKKITRGFGFYHDHRMCFTYCDSVFNFFDFSDNEYDGNVRKICESKTERVRGQCSQCKRCDVQSLNSPRENYQYQIAYPAVGYRHWAQRAKDKGELSLCDQAEKFFELHQDEKLPELAQETVEPWGERNEKNKSISGLEDVFFQFFSAQNNELEIEMDTTEVFEKNQFDVFFTQGLQYCDTPAWEKNQYEQARTQAKNNLDVLSCSVKNRAKVTALDSICSLMMRRQYPQSLTTENRKRAKTLSEAVSEPGEFLWGIRPEERFNTEFNSTSETFVADHTSSHLRAQNFRIKRRENLWKIPGVKPKRFMECCEYDGTYPITVEGFEPSIRRGQKSFDEMPKMETEVGAIGCPLAATQFEQNANTKPMHPMMMLAKAYRPDGFEKPTLTVKEE